MKTNILIGASDGYNWNTLKNWVLSSKVFTGKRVLLVYRMDDYTKKKCMEHGVELVEVNHDIYGEPINHDARVSVGAARTVSHEIRYFHAWEYLKDQVDVEFVVLTDTRDVIFQYDPVKFLNDNMRGATELLAPQEGILYKDEPWNRDNLYRGWGGYVYQMMSEKPVYNCGTIAGKMPFFANFVLTLWGSTTGKFAYPADQCSTGLLVETTLDSLVWKCGHDSGWCCQCGVTLDPEKKFLLPHLICHSPKIDNDGFVYTSKDQKYALVHQYERVPQLLEKINQRYLE